MLACHVMSHKLFKKKLKYISLYQTIRSFFIYHFILAFLLILKWANLIGIILHFVLTSNGSYVARLCQVKFTESVSAVFDS